jgi:prepilin-type N-terminal cleavage/methylation domain-containing protein
MNFKKKQKTISVGRQGFTLIEIIIAVSIFSIVIISLAGIFSSSIKGYRIAKATQKNLEDAQFIMNQMVKILRTSSIDSGSTSSELKIYDYSLSRCYRYRFENNKIQISFIPDSIPVDTPNPIGWCNDHEGSFSVYNDMANFYVKNGQFFSVSSNKIAGNEKLGKVTVSMELCQDAECLEDRIRIQSSASLRDYYNAGI